MAAGASAISTADSSITLRSRQRDLTELAVGYALILLVIWTPRPLQQLFYIAATAWIVIVTIISFDGRKAMGLRLTNSLRSLWIVGVSLLVSAIAILIASHLETLQRPIDTSQFVKLYWGYAIWSCMQQFLLQGFFLLRLLRLLPTSTAAVTIATAMFALAHLPNPILTPMTVLWGFAACLLFLRYRNLYPLAISHAILGICVGITVPGPIDHNMRVGLEYLTYQHQPINASEQKTIILLPTEGRTTKR